MKLALSVPKPTATRFAAAGILVFLFGGEVTRPAPMHGAVPDFQKSVNLRENRGSCGPNTLHPALYGVTCTSGVVTHAWHINGTVLKFDTRISFMPEALAFLFGQQADEVCRNGLCARISHADTDPRDRVAFEAWRHHLRP